MYDYTCITKLCDTYVSVRLKYSFKHGQGEPFCVKQYIKIGVIFVTPYLFCKVLSLALLWKPSGLMGLIFIFRLGFAAMEMKNI